MLVYVCNLVSINCLVNNNCCIVINSQFLRIQDVCNFNFLKAKIIISEPEQKSKVLGYLKIKHYTYHFTK